MKKFMKWKILTITCAVCLLPIIAGILLWDKLPAEIAIHFNMNNEPDNFASKGFAVFGLPLMMVALQVFCCVINDVNAKKYGNRKKFELATKWIIPVMTILLQAATFAYALEVEVDIRRFAMAIVAAILIVIGNYLPKFDYIKNFKGGKEADTEKARKINRFIGFATVIMGVLALITLFLPPISSVIWLFALIVYAAITVIYTVVELGRK